MSVAPRLSAQDVALKLDRLYAEKRRHHLFAFFGYRDEQESWSEVTTERAGPVAVISVRSELELREMMPPIGENGTPMAFLVPWSGNVPVDLAGRFAHSGRVYRIGSEARLRRMFNATALDDSVRQSHLGEFLQKNFPQYQQAENVGRLTAESMWTAWLKSEWKLDCGGGLALDVLMAWAATDKRGAVFLELAAKPKGAELRSELLQLLNRRLGPAGPAVWTLWEAGKASTALELGVLFEVLAESGNPVVGMWVRQLAKKDLPVEKDGELAPIASALGGAADSALRLVEVRDEKEAARAVAAAEGRVDEPEVQEDLIASHRLQFSWNMRFNRLGDLLSNAVSCPEASSVERAEAALSAIQDHKLEQRGETSQKFKRAEMAVRLLSWLAERTARPIGGGLGTYSDVEELSKVYAEEGGFVDRARSVARGSSENAFGMGVQKVVEAADQKRDEMDRLFARGLDSWVNAGRPAAQVIPIDGAIKRLASKFLQQNEERRLLVLLFDGMGWSQAVELLQSCADGPHGWAPLVWHQRKEGKIGDGRYPVVLAGLPTTTEVSRAEFFAGKPVEPGGKLDTAKDGDRFMKHTQLAKFFDGADYPKLFLRGEGHNNDGSAKKEARAFIEDPKHKVVGVVINAIDASLSGDAQHRVNWSQDNIKSLGEFLESARKSNRCVLIASDHGHVPSDRLTKVAAEGKGGARWRPWNGERDQLADYEVGIASKNSWAPKGAEGIALIADDGHSYSAVKSAGEHGGASLAEVVVPCLLLGYEDEIAAGADPSLAQTTLYEPGWWHFDVRDRRPVEESIPVPRVPAAKPQPAVGVQLDLLGAPPAAETTEVRHTPAEGSEGASAFAASDILHARASTADVRKKVVTAVEYLSARNGIASEEAFAAALSEHRYRVGGLISMIQEVLNVDGYEVIEHDHKGKQVRLNRERLFQQFEVEL